MYGQTPACRIEIPKHVLQHMNGAEHRRIERISGASLQMSAEGKSCFVSIFGDAQEKVKACLFVEDLVQQQTRGVLEVPNHLAVHMLGRAGVLIHDIENAYNVSVNVQRWREPCLFEVYGEKVAVEASLESLRHLAKPFRKQVEIPDQCLAQLVGNNGIGFSEIEKSSGARIHVDIRPCRSSTCVVEAVGEEGEVQHAVDLLQQRILSHGSSAEQTDEGSDLQADANLLIHRRTNTPPDSPQERRPLQERLLQDSAPLQCAPQAQKLAAGSPARRKSFTGRTSCGGIKRPRARVSLTQDAALMMKRSNSNSSPGGDSPQRASKVGSHIQEQTCGTPAGVTKRSQQQPCGEHDDKPLLHGQVVSEKLSLESHSSSVPLAWTCQIFSGENASPCKGSCPQDSPMQTQAPSLLPPPPPPPALPTPGPQTLPAQVQTLARSPASALAQPPAPTASAPTAQAQTAQAPTVLAPAPAPACLPAPTAPAPAPTALEPQPAPATEAAALPRSQAPVSMEENLQWNRVATPVRPEAPYNSSSTAASPSQLQASHKQRNRMHLTQEQTSDDRLPDFALASDHSVGAVRHFLTADNTKTALLKQCGLPARLLVDSSGLTPWAWRQPLIQQELVATGPRTNTNVQDSKKPGVDVPRAANQTATPLKANLGSAGCEHPGQSPTSDTAETPGLWKVAESAGNSCKPPEKDQDTGEPVSAAQSSLLPTASPTPAPNSVKQLGCSASEVYCSMQAPLSPTPVSSLLQELPGTQSARISHHPSLGDISRCSTARSRTPSFQKSSGSTTPAAQLAKQRLLEEVRRREQMGPQQTLPPYFPAGVPLPKSWLHEATQSDLSGPHVQKGLLAWPEALPAVTLLHAGGIQEPRSKSPHDDAKKCKEKSTAVEFEDVSHGDRQQFRTLSQSTHSERDHFPSQAGWNLGEFMNKFFKK